MTTRPSDSSLIENAIIATLGADPQLLSLMPNGVYYQVAPPNATRYVIVTLEDSTDVAEFGRRAQEDARFRITAVGLSSARPDLDGAAWRIDQLLEDQRIPVTGFVWATIHRLSRIRTADPDVANPDLRWRTRGGVYRAVYATALTGGPDLNPWEQSSDWLQEGWVQ